MYYIHLLVFLTNSASRLVIMCFMKFIFNAYGGDKCELDLVENKICNLYLGSGSSQKTVKNINH